MADKEKNLKKSEEEELKAKAEGEEQEDEQDKNDEGDKDKSKPEKKEFFLIRGAKKVWNGVKKVGSKVEEVVCDHPIAACLTSFGLGVGTMMLKEYLEGNDEDEEPEVLSLPEPETVETEFVEEEQEPEESFEDDESVEEEPTEEEV